MKDTKTILNHALWLCLTLWVPRYSFQPLYEWTQVCRPRGSSHHMAPLTCVDHLRVCVLYPTLSCNVPSGNALLGELYKDSLWWVMMMPLWAMLYIHPIRLIWRVLPWGPKIAARFESQGGIIVSMLRHYYRVITPIVESDAKGDAWYIYI